MASEQSGMADSLREVSVDRRTLRLRSPALRVEPNRERASALHSRRDLRTGRTLRRRCSPGCFLQDESSRLDIRESAYLPERVPRLRGFATGSNRMRDFGRRSSADLLALQLSFGNAAIELGDGQASPSPDANPVGQVKVWFSKPHGRRLHETRQASRRRRKPSRS